MRLYQYQCDAEGSLFYYQHESKPIPSHIVEHCPVCGSKGVALTGREYEPVDEQARLWGPIARTVLGLDESESEDISLEVEVTFGSPEGEPTEQSFWEFALDYFLEADNLNAFVEDTDFWHSRENLVLTGTTFRFDFDQTKLGDSAVELAGEAVRSHAVEAPNGDYHTFADDGNVVSRVSFTMEFKNPDLAHPVVSYIQGVQEGIPLWYT